MHVEERQQYYNVLFKFCYQLDAFQIRTLFVTLSDLLLNMYAKMFDIDKARSRDFAQDTYAAVCVYRVFMMDC